MTLTQKAPAKINLYLDVTGKLDNGYHTVKSVMQSVSLSDTVTATSLTPEAGECSVTLSCSDATLPCDETNLAVKAARIFFTKAGISEYSCAIRIEKNIPMAAGLAGGSTDAAAVLLLLNDLYGTPFTEDELCRIGAALGADVPFCISGGTCLAEGIGESLTALPPIPAAPIVIAVGGEGVSTPEAYRLIDEGFAGRLACDHGDISGMLRAVKAGDITAVAGSMYNIFEEVILPHRPVAVAIADTLRQKGAVGVMMSGSGPSVFGLFDSVENAKAAAEAVSATAHSVFVCTTGEIGDFIKIR